MFIGIHHVGYYVSDLEAVVQRYVALYGGVVELRLRNDATKTNVAFVRTGETRVELMEPDDKALLGGAEGQVLHHVGYLVPDIYTAADELRARGAKFVGEKPSPKNALGWQIWYFDGGPLMGVKQHIAQY
ncbi:MAG: VOC family protein [Chloroflexota bacterium]